MAYSDKDFLDDIREKFQNFSFEFRELDYKGKIPVFFIDAITEEHFYNSWTSIVDFIAFEFQSRLEDEFQIWNIYIFFIKPLLISDPVNFNSIKLKIENDTFSSRKIIVDHNNYDTIIDEHIINKNINFHPGQPDIGIGVLVPNAILSNILEGKILKKQKLTQEAGYAFEELVKQLKQQKP
ncbi:MAG: hypothetical protein EOO20_18270 [Chryseobacterium sp.]|nr:MAG: hypothetical protein EOO20_18270 [Chryseobacterium sp.]